MTGGGRVTEILTRPLFSLFMPELTAIIQPLSGEYAVRRDVLEQIPFPIGYGVETAHLMDVYNLYGLSAFGQTDLDQRVHRNQATRSLGKMSFGIMQTFYTRAEKMGLLKTETDLRNTLYQFREENGQYELEQHHIVEEERPPMIEIPDYMAKFHPKGR